MEEWKVGYLAAMLDGEGAIMIQKQKKKRCLSPRVTITNGDVAMLKFLQKEFGGNLHKSEKGCYNPNYADSYYLSWHGMSGKKLLRLILDKLITKKERAELYLAFPLGDGPGMRHTEEDISLREAIYLKMKELNQRGVMWEISEPHAVKGN